MNTNIFNDYYNYKKKTVFGYSILLSKIIGIKKNKLWHNRKSIEDSLEWIIKDYFKFLNSNKNNSNIIRLFISDKELSRYKIDNELASVLNYFIETKRGFEIKAYEKEIVLAAVIVRIANDLDIATSPYKSNKNNYKTILMNYLDKYNRIPYFILIDNGKKHINTLLEQVKDNVKKERKLFDTLNSKLSFNRYIDISSDNKYYLSQYNYSVPGIKNIDVAANKYVYEKENIDDKFALISKDIIIVTLMKLFSIRKLRKVFFLPIKVGFYQDKENVKELSYVYNDDYLSKYIKVLLNYNDYNEGIKELLESYNIDYYVYCSKNTSINNENDDIKQYLISNDFEEDNQEFVNKLINEGKKVIIENFEGIVNDNDLIEESEEN